MGDYANVYSIGVGQGQMNIVEVIDGNSNTPKGAHLFDCGGYYCNFKLYEPLIEEIMKNNGNKFKSIFISHTDSDHSDLLTIQFMGNYVDQSAPFYYAATDHYDLKKSGKIDNVKAVINKLKIHKNSIHILTGTSLGGGNKIQLVGTNDISVIIIASTGKGDPNDASMVLSLNIQDAEHAVFTGDATALTFSDAVNYMKNDVPYFKNKECRYVSIPHHGSSVTASEKDPNMTRLKEFGSVIQATSGVSSAKRKTWPHSCKEVIEATCQCMRNNIDNHTVYISYLSKNMRQLKGEKISKDSTTQSYFTNQTNINLKETVVSYRHRLKPKVLDEIAYYPPQETTAKTDFQQLNSINPVNVLNIIPIQKRATARCFSQFGRVSEPL